MEKVSQKSAAAMVGSAIFFSGMGAALKGVSPEVSTFQLSFFRAFVSALILIAVMYQRRIPLSGSNRPLLLIRALVGFTAMALNFYAIARIPLGDAATLNQSSPLLVLLFSYFLLKERVGVRLWLFSALGLIGILLILRPSSAVFGLGGLAGLSSALFAALAYLSIQRLHRSDSSWTMAFYFMAVASLLSLPPMLVYWTPLRGIDLGLMLLAGLLGTFGQLLLTHAYRCDQASWVAPFAYSGVILSFLWDILIFKHEPALWSLLGALCIIVSGMGVLRMRRSS